MVCLNWSSSARIANHFVFVRVFNVTILLIGLLVQLLNARFWSNRALLDKSMTIGTRALFDEPVVLGDRVTLDCSRGYHGNHLKILLFTKTHITRVILLLSL